MTTETNPSNDPDGNKLEVPSSNRSLLMLVGWGIFGGGIAIALIAKYLF